MLTSNKSKSQEKNHPFPNFFLISPRVQVLEKNIHFQILEVLPVILTTYFPVSV